MKNMELFEALGNMDDKYIVDARIKPMPVMASSSEHSFSAFFKNAVSVAAIFLVIGVIFVWTLVGKDIINAYHGDDTTSDMTTTEPQTTPNKPQISVFRTENISRITFYPQNGYGEACEVPSKYMTEITNWLKTFTIDKKLEDGLLPPGTNSVYVKIEYSDGAVIRNGLSLISIDGIRYYMKHDIEPECYWEILSQTPPDPSTTTDNGIVPPIPSTDTTTKPWHTTIPITTTVPPVTDITTTTPITTTQPPVTTTTTTPVTPPQPITLSQAQLEEIQSFLNDDANNGFVGVNRYNSPSEIKLSFVFRNGAGIQIEKDQWAEGEAEAVLKSGWSEIHSPTAKIPRQAANALLLEKCGLSLDAWRTFPYWYVEAYDAYYYTHSEDIRFSVIIESGQIDQNGQYIINYALFDGCFSDDMYTVTLSKTDKGYQFISNIDIDDDHDPYAIHEISADKLTVDGTKKTYNDQSITLSVPADWLTLEQHGEDGTVYTFQDPTSDNCELYFYSTGSIYAIHRTEAEYLALFKSFGYGNVKILSYTKEKISGYDCTKVVYSYTEDGNAYIGTRYDNVIRGLGMYEFSTVYPAAESERFAKVFESIMDSIVLKPD